jgi:hypothetical protein
MAFLKHHSIQCKKIFWIIRQMSRLNDKTIARLVVFGPSDSLLSDETINSMLIRKVPPPGEPGSSSGGRTTFEIIENSPVQLSLEEATRPPRLVLCRVIAHKRVRRLKESPIGQIAQYIMT